MTAIRNSQTKSTTHQRHHFDGAFCVMFRVQTWCKFGAKTYRTIRKLCHDIRWKRHKITQNGRCSTIFRGINASEKTRRDNLDLWSIQKMLSLCAVPLRTLRNEINPLRDLWNALCAWNSLSASEMPAGVRGFISFHIEQSEIFHNVRQNIISHFAEQNISLYAFVSTNAVLAKKRGQRM